jgi:hypothetical protein
MRNNYGIPQLASSRASPKPNCPRVGLPWPPTRWGMAYSLELLMSTLDHVSLKIHLYETLLMDELSPWHKPSRVRISIPPHQHPEDIGDFGS